MGRRPQMELTKRNREVLRAIITLSHRLGHAPSHKEIAGAVGLASTDSVAKHIEKLCVLGYVSREPHQARTLRVLAMPESR